jgi:hypothetical protein
MEAIELPNGQMMWADMDTPRFREAYTFHLRHGGYSWRPDDETQEEGHRRAATLFALAEAEAEARGWSVVWGDDWDGDHSYLEPGESVDTCELATLHGADGGWLDAVGCVDDADGDYRRVISAQLYLKALS